MITPFSSYECFENRVTSVSRAEFRVTSNEFRVTSSDSSIELRDSRTRVREAENREIDLRVTRGNVKSCLIVNCVAVQGNRKAVLSNSAGVHGNCVSNSWRVLVMWTSSYQTPTTKPYTLLNTLDPVL